MLIVEKDLYLILAVDNRGPYVDFGWEIYKNTYARSDGRYEMSENFNFKNIFDLIKRTQTIKI